MRGWSPPPALSPPASEALVRWDDNDNPSRAGGGLG